MNRSKKRGTAFETALVRWLQERLGDERIERRALHGSKDMGDIYGLVCHGNAEGIVEAKAHATVTPSLVSEWQRQTEDEQANACADFALLAIKTPGVGQKSLGRTRVRMTTSSLLAISGVAWLHGAHDSALTRWVETDLETVCSLMEGDSDGRPA